MLVFAYVTLKQYLFSKYSGRLGVFTKNLFQTKERKTFLHTDRQTDRQNKRERATQKNYFRRKKEKTFLHTYIQTE